MVGKELYMEPDVSMAKIILEEYISPNIVGIVFMIPLVEEVF